MSEAIWKSPLSAEEMNRRFKNTLAEHLGIEITEVGNDFVKGTMPFNQAITQPMGLIHGGANVVLAESLGSIGAAMMVDREKYVCVGQEINANHVRAVRDGLVTGIAKPVYVGKTSQVWDIRLYDSRDKLTCISRLTMAAIKKTPQE